MDRRQYYLQKIAEEALEVATAAMKCIQFGNESRDPSKPDSLTNIEELQYEIKDFQGAKLAAEMNGIIPTQNNVANHVTEKWIKIDKYYDLCVKLGTVKE
jgi:hypothetical protein